VSWAQAYTTGSAFYGIYFMVSYPLFATLDEPDEEPKAMPATHSLRSTVLEALGAGMAVLMLLDFVRVALDIELRVPLQRPCKIDASLTCSPFGGSFC
jgi:cycloeucalenol cycloisomerase